MTSRSYDARTMSQVRPGRAIKSSPGGRSPINYGCLFTWGRIRVRVDTPIVRCRATPPSASAPPPPVSASTSTPAPAPATTPTATAIGLRSILYGGINFDLLNRSDIVRVDDLLDPGRRLVFGVARAVFTAEGSCATSTTSSARPSPSSTSEAASATSSCTRRSEFGVGVHAKIGKS